MTGFVRNLPDGRVELVAEGPPHALDQLLADISDAMSGHIDSADIQTSPVTGKYASFEVAF